MQRQVAKKRNEEVKKDKTLGTQLGHYLYVDPRNKSGWDYEFYQSIQVEENTTAPPP